MLYLISVAGILLAPAVIGLFWGAPLIAHELETGTSALAWTQSITRTRWLAVKLTVGGTGSIFKMGRFSLLVFATHGITPLGYAAFAFTLGVTVGALIGRTVPAMAVALAVFAVIQIAMPLWIRPHLFPARQTVVPITSLESTSLSLSTSNGSSGNSFVFGSLNLPGQPGAWTLSSTTVNPAGQATSLKATPTVSLTISGLAGPAGGA